MIILPAIGAIVALLAPIVEAALVAAGIGAVISGATCGIGGAVSGYQELGELNRDVAISSAHSAAECAAKGALFGAVTAPVGLVVAPIVAPAIQVVDDVARPVVQVIDDAARPVLNNIDDIGAPISRNLSAAAHSAHMSTEKVVTKALRNVRRGMPPPIQRLLPRSARSAGHVYVMEDAVTGARKIGMSVDPKRRLGEIKRAVGNEVNLTCTISTYNMRALESALHSAHAGTRLPNIGAGTEWFKLSSSQVKAICG